MMLVDTYMCQQTEASLVQITAYRLFGAKSLLEPILTIVIQENQPKMTFYIFEILRVIGSVQIGELNCVPL